MQETTPYISKKILQLPNTSPDKLNNEGLANTALVIERIERCIGIKDVVGTEFWCKEAVKVIRLKEKFSLEQRKSFCSLVYPFLFTINDLLSQATIGKALAQMLWKKRKHIPIKFDVQSLVNLAIQVHFQPLRETEYQGAPTRSQHASMICSLASAIRRYTLDGTAEKLINAFFPSLCPHDRGSLQSCIFLSLFLPSSLDQISIEKLLVAWKLNHINPAWDNNFLQLFARVAKYHAFYGDQLQVFDRFIPDIMTHFLRILDVSVSTGGVAKLPRQGFPQECYLFNPGQSNTSFDMAKFWIYLIRADHDEALDHFLLLCDRVDQLFHPSNSDHIRNLCGLVSKITTVLGSRLNLEKKRGVEPSRCMSEAQIDKLTEKLICIAQQLLFAKNESISQAAGSMIKVLSHLRPSSIFPSLLDSVYDGLLTVNATHRTPSCLRALVYSASALFSPKVYGEVGIPHHLNKLLDMSLSAIDPNDPTKTVFALAFLSNVLHYVPLHTINTGSEVSPEIVEASAYFKEWSGLCIKKVLSYLEQQADDVDSSFTWLDCFCEVFFHQMSPEIFEANFGYVTSFIRSNILSNTMGLSRVLVSGISAHPTLALKPLLQALGIQPFHEGFLLDMSEERAKWIMEIFAIICNGKWADTVEENEWNTMKLVALEGIKDHRKKVYYAAAESFSGLVASPTFPYLTELSSWKGLTSEGERMKPGISWGATTQIHRCNPSWHIPTQREIDRAQNIFDISLSLIREELAADAKEKTGGKARIMRALQLLDNVVNGSWFLLRRETLNPENEVEEEGSEASDDLYWKYFRGNVSVRGGEALLSSEKSAAMIKDLEVLLNEIYLYLIPNRSDDAEAIASLCSTIGLVLNRGRVTNLVLIKVYENMLDEQERLFLKREVGGYMPRSLCLKRIRLLNLKRLQEADFSTSTASPEAELLLDHLYQMSIGPYSLVRQAAQTALVQSLKFYRKSFNKIVKNILAEVGNPEISEDSITGHCYLLMNRPVMRKVSRQWRYLAPFIQSFIRTHIHSKPTIQARVYAVFIYFFSSSYALPTILETSQLEESAEIAGVPNEAVKASINRAKRFSRFNEEHRSDIFKSLMSSKQELEQSHWRYIVIHLTGLLLMQRSSRIPSPDVIKLFLESCVSDLSPIRKISMAGVMWMLENVRQSVKSSADTKKHEDGRIWKGWLEYSEIFKEYNFDYNNRIILEKKRQGKAVNEEELRAIESTVSGFLKNEEWHTKLFFHLVEDHSVHAESDESNSQDNSSNRMLTGIMRRLVDANSVLPMLLSQLNRSQQAAEEIIAEIGVSHKQYPVGGKWSRDFSLFNVLFLQSFLGLPSCMPDAISVFTESLKKLAVSDIRRNQIMASEIAATLLRSAVTWQPDALKTHTINDVAPLVWKTIETTTLDNAKDWASSLRFICYGIHPRDLPWMFALFQNPIRNSISGTVQAIRLYCIDAVMCEMNWRLDQIKASDVGLTDSSIEHATVLDYILWHLSLAVSHSHKQVRILIRDVIASCLAFSWSCNKQVHENKRAVIDSILAKTQAQVDESPEQLLQADSPVRLRSKARESLLNVIIAMCWNGMSLGLYEYWPVLLPTIISTTQDPDKDTAKGAKGWSAVLAQLFFPSAIASKVLEVLLAALSQAEASNSQWRQRQFIVAFLQLYTFCHQFVLNAAEIEAVQHATINCLQDEHIEVRMVAMNALSSLLKGASTATISNGVNTFEKNANVGGNTRVLKAKLRKKDITEEEKKKIEKDIITRHGGILGMSALVKLHPYDVPMWLAPVIVSLAQHAGDPDPIGQSVSATLQEFKKTHADAWLNMRSIWFTPDQLDSISEFLTSPSYFG